MTTESFFSSRSTVPKRARINVFHQGTAFYREPAEELELLVEADHLNERFACCQSRP